MYLRWSSSHPLCMLTHSRSHSMNHTCIVANCKNKINGMAEDGNRESRVGVCCVGGRTECDLLSLFPLTADGLKLIQTGTLQADSHAAGWHHSRYDLCPYQVPYFIKHSLGVTLDPMFLVISYNIQ